MGPGFSVITLGTRLKPREMAERLAQISRRHPSGSPSNHVGNSKGCPSLGQDLAEMGAAIHDV